MRKYSYITLETSLKSEVVSALNYAKENFSALEFGRFSIPNTSIFGIKICYETKSIESEIQYELHKKNFDLHFLVEGEECISILKNDSQMNISSSYNEIDDYQLLTSNERNCELIRPNEYILFELGEAHATGYNIDNVNIVHKVVLKIPFELVD
ncbi:DUF386 domain-containing protein [Corallincola luteus]|uniref:DUF386 domain-containing protein n=1 Tax=Corallincola luteus TaxID=1775177 RepID=A0ABY2AQG4_9GAMM|nr:YhcH/YjgK/YiaL family protein [Corallincola luteus]TCI05426.1 DUF386 domain-containing protein [Corallincola luteus]